MSFALRVIRDPVHNYIPISVLEHKIINDPVFLRLQHITQNGLAYFTYPGNRTSRFAHSLGCMHVGGMMVRALLANDYSRLVPRFEQAVLNDYLRPRGIRLQDITDYLGKEADPFYLHMGIRLGETVPTILLQSVRIACVVHDLGHFPYSHTLEDVITHHRFLLPTTGAFTNYEQQQFKETFDRLIQADLEWAAAAVAPGTVLGGKLHEPIGRMLSEGIFQRVTRGGERVFAETCLHLGIEIARAEEDEAAPPRTERERVLQCLHGIVSGPLDADRMDYIRRDGRASGFEFGEYDLERIVTSLRIAEVRGRLAIRPSTTAVSAAEAFFLERYRIYRWLVYHHNVVRADLALSRSLATLIEVMFDATGITGGAKDAIRNQIQGKDLRRLWQALWDPVGSTDYTLCDEPWLYTMLQAVYSALPGAGSEPLDLLVLRACLGMVCRREKRSLITLWKRVEQYRGFAARFQAVASEARFNTWFGARPELSALRGEPERAIEFVNGMFTEVLQDQIRARGHLTTMKRLEQAVQPVIPGAVLLYFADFKPKQPFELVDVRSGTPIPLEKLSALWGDLDRIWGQDIELYAGLAWNLWVG